MGRREMGRREMGRREMGRSEMGGEDGKEGERRKWKLERGAMTSQMVSQGSLWRISDLLTSKHPMLPSTTTSQTSGGLQ